VNSATKLNIANKAIVGIRGADADDEVRNSWSARAELLPKAADADDTIRNSWSARTVSKPRAADAVAIAAGADADADKMVQ
jgi:hypothetical protein